MGFFFQIASAIDKDERFIHKNPNIQLSRFFFNRVEKLRVIVNYNAREY